MKTSIFDVLIVYSQDMADSSASASPLVVAPFGPRSGSLIYNDVYAYFIKACQQNGLKVAFTTSADVTGAGTCGSYWLVKKSGWTKVAKPGYASLIFDKLSPKTKELADQRTLLFSSPTVQSFNSPYIHQLFFDKHKTYAKLKNVAIPTAVIAEHTLSGVTRAHSHLDTLMKSHPHSQDFSSDIIMKDRFGSGGNNIYKFKKNQLREVMATLNLNSSSSFIIQPFTKFDKGYSFKDTQVSADIRLVFLKGKIVQSYVRMAKADSYLCNEHQGGSLAYISEQEIPPQVMSKAQEILQILDKQSSLFSLDFVMSNNGNAYFLEGNTGPGLDWNPSIPLNIKRSKEFIGMVANELARRAGVSTSAHSSPMTNPIANTEAN